jgi:hypothetical protein
MIYLHTYIISYIRTYHPALHVRTIYHRLTLETLSRLVAAYLVPCLVACRVACLVAYLVAYREIFISELVSSYLALSRTLWSHPIRGEIRYEIRILTLTNDLPCHIIVPHNLLY